MAYDENGDWQDESSDWFADNTPPPAQDTGGGGGGGGSSSSPVGSVDNPDMSMINRDSGSWEQYLKASGGDLYDPSDLAGVQRNVSYARNAGQDPLKFLQQQDAIYAHRRSNVPNGARDDGSMPGGGGGGSSGWASPNSIQPWGGTFRAPTQDEAMNTPGFQFQLGEGLKALQRSAAAKGTLLTGGTMKGLTDYATNAANNHYNDVYNQAYNTYQSGRNDFLTNEMNRYNSQRANLNDQYGMFNTNRNFDFNVFDANRNFNRGLNNDYFGNILSLGHLATPPNPYA